MDTVQQIVTKLSLATAEPQDFNDIGEFLCELGTILKECPEEEREAVATMLDAAFRFYASIASQLRIYFSICENIKVPKTLLTNLNDLVAPRLVRQFSDDE